MRTALLMSVAAMAALCVGCGTGNRLYTNDDSYDRGLVVILPGIEGEGLGSASVRSGLASGGVNQGLTVHAWGRPVPLLGPMLNQMDAPGNRVAAERLARMIEEYMDEHPGAPVHIVGHSGGGGVAVFTAEEMKPGYRLDGLILLHASISADYNLSAALANVNKGIVSYWSERDFALLNVGTTMVGNVDGEHGPSAGGVGFSRSYPGLYEREWNESMARFGHYGGHIDVVNSRFIANVIAPWVMAKQWPVD